MSAVLMLLTALALALLALAMIRLWKVLAVAAAIAGAQWTIMQAGDAGIQFAALAVPALIAAFVILRLVGDRPAGIGGWGQGVRA
ncbi:hypothetical protein [Actinokineospora terrae]|uniref:Uncharacterized protein n=1 Tax=Actinokineospora terrae TaxID=155974 RepID=A0A1H9VHD4_9PSEU|nr:hypothetical protein [Actinokineospora terrae]SES20693.1 hypothetical protein SAMN04487818_108345 [Actinokineospora terrae]